MSRERVNEPYLLRHISTRLAGPRNSTEAVSRLASDGEPDSSTHTDPANYLLSASSCQLVSPFVEYPIPVSGLLSPFFIELSVMEIKYLCWGQIGTRLAPRRQGGGPGKERYVGGGRNGFFLTAFKSLSPDKYLPRLTGR